MTYYNIDEYDKDKSTQAEKNKKEYLKAYYRKNAKHIANKRKIFLIKHGKTKYMYDLQKDRYEKKVKYIESQKELYKDVDKITVNFY
jgi:hypothetical protein